MKHAVATLEGELLDAAVSKAEGRIVAVADHWGFVSRSPEFEIGWDPVEKYSTDRAIGGEIIEREHICTWWQDADGWNAGYDLGLGSGEQDGWLDADHWMLGNTPLIAGLRTYLAKMFGEEVDLP